MSLTTINSQARQYLFNTNEIVHGTIRFLLALFPFCPPCGLHVKSNPAGRGKPSESRDKKRKSNLKFKTYETDDLVKLKNADKTNKYGCYGFLPENNEQYLGEYDDSSLINCLGTSKDGEELYKDILDMYYYKIKNQNWTENDNVSILLSGNYSDYKSLSSVGYALLGIDGLRIES